MVMRPNRMVQKSWQFHINALEEPIRANRRQIAMNSRFVVTDIVNITDRSPRDPKPCSKRDAIEGKNKAIIITPNRLFPTRKGTRSRYNSTFITV